MVQFTSLEWISSHRWSQVNGVDTLAHVHHFAAFGAPVPCDDPARFPQFFDGWGPGQPPFLFPDEVGIPIGNDGGFVSVNLQIHYDNLAAVPDLLDSTGIRLYYTSTLREHSAGVLFVGDPYTARQPAPIGVGPTQDVLTCPTSACTAFEFAQDHGPITVFTEAFHMHETGVRAVNEQIRDGEVVRESSVDFFDFWAGGIQHARQEPFALQAGDGFRTSCYYNSVKEGVLFGNGTRDEMCVAFLWVLSGDFANTCIWQQCSRRGEHGKLPTAISPHIQHTHFWSPTCPSKALHSMVHALCSVGILVASAVACLVLLSFVVPRVDFRENRLRAFGSGAIAKKP